MHDQENVIKLDDTPLQAVVKMSEGNPGAIKVLMEIMKKSGIITICHLDDLQIRGWKIWYGYKDYCKEDLDKFIECATKRDQKMIDFINEYGK